MISKPRNASPHHRGMLLFPSTQPNLYPYPPLTPQVSLDISEAVNMQMRRGKEWEGIFSCRRKSGDILHFSSRVTPIALQGRWGPPPVGRSAPGSGWKGARLAVLFGWRKVYPQRYPVRQIQSIKVTFHDCDEVTKILKGAGGGAGSSHKGGFGGGDLTSLFWTPSGRTTFWCTGATITESVWRPPRTREDRSSHTAKGPSTSGLWAAMGIEEVRARTCDLRAANRHHAFDFVFFF